MADPQRIHPVDLESQQKPTAPLVPQELSRSEKGDPAIAAGQLQYPPLRRNIPVSHSRPPKRRRGNCCCRCICWSICTLILLLILIAVTLFVLYLVFDPKLPKYSVDRLQISNFSVDSNLMAHTSFDVTVTAENPNKDIGIYYENGSKLSVWYSGYSLSEGTFPVFYQGHRNTTVVTVVMSGEAQFGGEVMNALQQQQQSGMIPLEFEGDVPVRVQVGALKLWKVTSKVRCSLVVNSLVVNNQIKIRSSSCKFSLKL